MGIETTGLTNKPVVIKKPGRVTFAQVVIFLFWANACTTLVTDDALCVGLSEPNTRLT